ncbi:conserved hypothetical protein [Deferribacter desulfuricans SSM1]|uniref:4Fe-4S ferredoxin-type domain-containing protein n=1 Tax=Deferribacter desulfuricans (strain DSM 14783 / JCM 11476 / NBRC 101012 / SSM1) TaxID=639282 RepID=D3PD90_DEFDS|nr:DUF362 domain-containing protein [Deferribacter desulfuricans]BAI80563.1 conserved hypothetical protein [Deferribacter desulfuricans SSM1]
MNVTIEKVSDYDVEKLKDFFLNSLTKSRKFKNQKKVLLKPNLLQASPPDKAITTHPLFIKGVVLALLELDSSIEILIGDSPGANFINYNRVLERTGMLDIINEFNISPVKIEEYPPKIYNGLLLSSIVEHVDCIINLAKLKTHSLTGLTLCVKNLFGLIPGNYKVKYHKDYPVNKELGVNIAKIYEFLKNKTISFIDGILAHEGEGPSRGRANKLGIVGFSDDAEVLDMAITKLLGLPPEFCKTNIYFIDKVDNIEDCLPQNLKINGIKLPISTKIDFLPNWLKKFVADSIKVKPEIMKSDCIKCYLCYKSCPVEAISLDNDKFPVVNKNDCIECYCCYEVCESDAIRLKRSLLHRLYVR